MRKLALLICLSCLPVWAKGATDYTLTFHTYPSEASWRPVRAAESPQWSRVPLSLSELDIRGGKTIRIRFHSPHFVEKEFEFSLSELTESQAAGTVVVDPEGTHQLVWPTTVTLLPNSSWEGLLYSLGYQWQATSLGLFLVSGAGLFGWTRHRRSQVLLSHQSRLQDLARQARHGGDSLVAAQAELGPYKVVDKLGEGGMATVYRAVPSDSLDPHEAVAIKLMKAELTSPEDRKRFLREIATVRALQHPNIVRLEYQGETLDGELFMALELVEGQPLQIPAQGLPLEEVTRLLEPMVAAVAYAHSQGVVHRDLKPANVMVSSAGQIKVMDFGLARSHDATKVTRTGTVLGSPAYIPPEQLSGGQLDARSDQYSLGATLYEMLTGRVPFPRDDTMSTLMAHMLELPVSLREWRPELPPSIDRVVRRTLEKAPAARYVDLEAMLLAWREALAHPDAFSEWNPSPAAAQVREQKVEISGDAGDETLC